MKSTNQRTILAMCASAVLLAGCGGGMGGCGGQKDDQSAGGGMLFKDDTANGGTPAEELGPQYQKPTIEVLQGKPQKFPARYPLRKYPNSRVVMAVVEPNLHPGQHNVVLLKSTDDGKQVARFYYEDLIKQGWKPVASQGNVAFSQIKYQKDGQEVEVRIFPDPHGGEQVQLLSGPWKEEMKYEQKIVDPRSNVGED
jgi:hypothetical protein